MNPNFIALLDKYAELKHRSDRANWSARHQPAENLDTQKAVVAQEILTAANTAEPQFNVELPDGDEREVKIWSVAQNAGSWTISISIEPSGLDMMPDMPSTEDEG